MHVTSMNPMTGATFLVTSLNTFLPSIFEEHRIRFTPARLTSILESCFYIIYLISGSSVDSASVYNVATVTMLSLHYESVVISLLSTAFKTYTFPVSTA